MQSSLLQAAKERKHSLIVSFFEQLFSHTRYQDYSQHSSLPLDFCRNDKSRSLRFQIDSITALMFLGTILIPIQLYN